MAANLNSVTVTVCTGRNIGKAGAKIDTFVVIQLENVKFRTSVALKSSEPVWNEDCEFYCKNKFVVLTLTVYHKTTFFDEFLGQIRLPLDEIYELYDTRPRSCWYPLKGKSGKKDEHEYIGELSIRIEFTTKKENLLVSIDDRFDSLSLSSQKKNNLHGFRKALKKAIGNKHINRSKERVQDSYSLTNDTESKAAINSSSVPHFNRTSSYNADLKEEKASSNDLPIIKPDLVPDDEIIYTTNGIEARDVLKAASGGDLDGEFLSTPIQDNYWKRMSSFGKAGGFNPDSAFDMMSRVELLDTVKKQRLELSRCLKRIRDLEEYIDQLTLRVLDAQPDLLLGPFSRTSSARYQAYKS